MQDVSDTGQATWSRGPPGRWRIVARARSIEIIVSAASSHVPDGARPETPAAHRDSPPGAWRFLVLGVTRLLRVLRGWRIAAEAPHPAPEPGRPLVVIFNHTSGIDGFLVAATVWRELGQWIQPLVKESVFKVPILGALGRAAGGIPVLRNTSDGRERAFDAAVEAIHAGGTVTIAPEGTITHDGALLPLRHGAARLAIQADVDVLIVTHFGAQRAFSPVRRFPERGVIVTMAMDLIRLQPGETANELSGRIAATMLDRSAELRADYPQADPTAAWWPPYAQPASPSEQARENIERYRISMAEAVHDARERMTEMAAEHELPERLREARERARLLAHELADEFSERAHARTDHLREAAHLKADELRETAHVKAEEFRETAQQKADEVRESAHDKAEELKSRARQRRDGESHTTADADTQPDEGDQP